MFTSKHIKMSSPQEPLAWMHWY